MAVDASLCPACQTPLKRGYHMGTILDSCPRCQGVWFDSGELRTYFDALLAARPDLGHGPLVLRKAIPGRETAKSPCGLCPRCRVPMTTLNYAYDSNIFLERCGTCGGLWVDSSKLAPLAHYLRGNPKLDKLGMSIVEHDDEQRLFQDAVDVAGGMGRPQYYRGLVWLPIMFLPLGDTLRRRRFPRVTLSLLGANVLIFVFQRLAVPNLEAFFQLYGMVPERLASGEHFYAPLTYMFLHANLVHLLGNGLFLYVFGDNVEDAMGHLVFLAFYLVCGIAGALGFFVLHAHGGTPVIGASGAISGIMGAYLVLFPRAGLRILLFFRVVTIPAVIAIAFWFFIQALYTLLETAGPELTNVAWSAHVAAFLFGALLAFVLSFINPGMTKPPA